MNASVIGNTVVTIPGSTDTTSWIMMRYVSGVMSGNTAKSFPVSDSPNLKQANNKTNTISSSLAEQAIEAWYQANLATLPDRSEEHTSELQSLMRISYAVFCLKKKRQRNNKTKPQ